MGWMYRTFYEVEKLFDSVERLSDSVKDLEKQADQNRRLIDALYYHLELSPVQSINTGIVHVVDFKKQSQKGGCDGKA